MHLSKLFVGSVASLAGGLLLLVQASVVPASLNKIDQVFVKLEGIREKCFVEELPEQTVALCTATTGSIPSSSASFSNWGPSACV